MPAGKSEVIRYQGLYGRTVFVSMAVETGVNDLGSRVLMIRHRLRPFLNLPTYYAEFSMRFERRLSRAAVANAETPATIATERSGRSEI